jgi:flagellin
VSVRINTNIEALNAQRNLSATALTFSKSVEKLSSGLRINRAADDAAGLAISEKLQAQVTGLNQAQRNAQDGISMVQTAEGALNEVHSMLQRIRELAVEASNSTLSSSDAQSVSTEITALRAEIDRIAGATTFNGQYLLTGALSVNQTGGTIAAGKALLTGGNATLSAIDLSGAKASTSYKITSNPGAGTVTLSDGNGNAQTVTLATTIGASGVEVINFTNLGVKLTVTGASSKNAADLATDLASSVRFAGSSATDAVVGDVLGTTPATSGGTITAMTVTPAVAADTYTLSSSGGALVLKDHLGATLGTSAVVTTMQAGGTQTLTFGGVSLTITAGAGGFAASDILTALTAPADDTVVVTGAATGDASVITGAGAGANFQVGANAADSMGVTFADAQLNAAHTAAGYGALYTDISNFATATTTNGGSGIITGAQQLITDVDVAIGYVSTIRGNLGAVQNRLEHTVASISVASENLNASESRIRDLDVASEMVNFTKTQILQQAGTAILAQANSAPQNILTLLR